MKILKTKIKFSVLLFLFNRILTSRNVRTLRNVIKPLCLYGILPINKIGYVNALHYNIDDIIEENINLATYPKYE